jgi:hypothetical protein
MVALLRHMYDLPYRTPGSEAWPTRLDSYAVLYATAAKYFIKDLQAMVGDAILFPAGEEEGDILLDHISDFVRAFRRILSCTPSDDRVRKLMMKTCATNLKLLLKEEEFFSLLREPGDLCAEIMGHEDLERAIYGSWMCSRRFENQDKVTPTCSGCTTAFRRESAWNSRYRETWYCSECEENLRPKCGICDEEVVWIQRGIV